MLRLFLTRRALVLSPACASGFPTASAAALFLASLCAAPAWCGWETVFEDNFDSLNTKNWSVSANGRDNAQFVPENISFKNGKLDIHTKVQAYGNYKYTSGGIESQHKRSFHPSQYGGKIRIESRVKIPKGKGVWPAFWTKQEMGGWPPEIDIYETLGLHPNRLYMSYHYLAAGVHQHQTVQWEAPWDYSQDFHDYAVVWSADSITWEVDGAMRAKETDKQLISELGPQYLILYTQMGLAGWDGNWPPDDAALPVDTYFDWVRVSKWNSAIAIAPASPAQTGTQARAFRRLMIETGDRSGSGLALPPGGAWNVSVYDLQGHRLGARPAQGRFDATRELGLHKGMYMAQAVPVP